MEDEATFLEPFPLVSVFEEESSSSDEDTGELPHEDSDQEDPNELDPDQEVPDEVDPDKLNPKKLNLDAVVTLAAATFTSKTSTLEARSLRCIHANKLDEPLTNDAVLDALAYLSVNETSPCVAIGLTMKPLQLVVTTIEEIPSPTIVKHLNTIYSTLKNISDAKFCTCSDLNFSNADIREESPNPDFVNKILLSHYNNLFLQIYKYSHDRLQTKYKKRLKVLEDFASQFSAWRTKVTREQGNKYNIVEPHKFFFGSISSFWRSALCLRDTLLKLSQSGWEFDATEMDTFRTSWHNIQARAEGILGQKVGDISMCDYWALRVSSVGQRPDKKEKPLQLRCAIEKLVSFHCHVFTLIRFANSKRMRSAFFSSKITVISAEKRHPFALSWPSNKQEWGDLLGSIYHKHGLERVCGSDMIKAERKVKLRATKCGVAKIIHCECAMVTYLHQYADFQAFSYIGVSKLCCKACYYWIEAFNCTMSTTFRTRGSHDKWYGGWARPGLGKAANQGKVEAVFLNYVERELCKHQLGNRMARKIGASDSSGSHERIVPMRPRGYEVSGETELMYGELFSDMED